MSLVIVNTDCANLTSVKFAFERLGIKPEITADRDRIRNAERVVLPGVGTARAAMRNLHERELVDTLQALKQPVLGICLGMQLLTDYSTEGDVACLGLIPARTEALPSSTGLTLPHMGWNTLTEVANNPLTKNLPAEAYCYFVHSYAVAPNEYTIATCDYGSTFAAMIRRDNFFGAQFHPERSSAVGAQILKNFLAMEL